MTHSPIEHSNAERAEWPETTREYVEWLEAQHNNLLFGAYSDKSLLSQIEDQARDGLPIEIGGRQYVPSTDLAEAAQEARARALDAERFKYVLEGVRGAIQTGRNEPLAIWADQIDIALQATAKGGV